MAASTAWDAANLAKACSLFLLQLLPEYVFSEAECERRVNTTHQAGAAYTLQQLWRHSSQQQFQTDFSFGPISPDSN